MTQQTKTWQSDFGRAYTDRNVIDPLVRYPAFQKMLEGLDIATVLEAGCNRGHNLVALSHLLGSDCSLIGVEPNPYALRLGTGESRRVQLLRASVYGLPFKEGNFDLVFTSGVLIHLPLSDLPSALAEIYRVTRRYVLALEYYAPEETAIHYRGHGNLLWKRDFLRHYQGSFPRLELRRSGYWESEHGFNRTSWWLLEKPPAVE